MKKCIALLLCVTGIFCACRSAGVPSSSASAIPAAQGNPVSCLYSVQCATEADSGLVFCTEQGRLMCASGSRIYQMASGVSRNAALYADGQELYWYANSQLFRNGQVLFSLNEPISYGLFRSDGFYSFGQDSLSMISYSYAGNTALIIPKALDGETCFAEADGYVYYAPEKGGDTGTCRLRRIRLSTGKIETVSNEYPGTCRSALIEGTFYFESGGRLQSWVPGAEMKELPELPGGIIQFLGAYESTLYYSCGGILYSWCRGTHTKLFSANILTLGGSPAIWFTDEHAVWYTPGSGNIRTSVYVGSFRDGAAALLYREAGTALR